MSSWAPPSGSACRSGTAGRTLVSWRSRLGWNRPAGAPRRTLDRCGGAARLPARLADARAAHPSREGDLQHLHRPGAAGRGGLHVRRVPRRRGIARHRPACPPPHRRPGGRAPALRFQPGPRELLRHRGCRSAANGRRRWSLTPVRAGCSCASSTRIMSGSRVARRPRRSTSRRCSLPSGPTVWGCPATVPCRRRFSAGGRSWTTRSSRSTIPRRPCCAICVACRTRTLRSIAA